MRLLKGDIGNSPMRISCGMKWVNKQSELNSTISGSIKVSGKLPTYPSPKTTLSLTSHLGQNFGLGEG